MVRYMSLLTVCALLALVIAGCPATDTTSDTDTTTARTLSGALNASDAAKRAPYMQDAEQHYSIIVQSTESQQTYTGETDADGNFQVDIPASETGEVFMVSVMMPDGQPAGPVLFNTDSTLGYTGLGITGDMSLGTIPFPDDPTAAPILPGTDATFAAGDVATDVIARLNNDGVPVGVPSFGRGNDAEGTASQSTAQQLDADQDGMVNNFDADDDGDGTIDDFDDDSELNPGGDGVEINFFMNLKIDDVQATAYFSGNTTGIETSLKEDTVITFEVQGNSTLSKTITAARIIGPPSPAPTYMPLMTVQAGTLWSAASYALRPDGTNHFQEWATPHNFMNTGDTFTVEITYDDGTVEVYSRMINYVFKSIPKLINVGPPGALAFFDGPKVIAFDGTQDLSIRMGSPGGRLRPFAGRAALSLRSVLLRQCRSADQRYRPECHLAQSARELGAEWTVL